MRCKAKAKQTGERCKRAAMVGKSVCYMHGGKAGAPANNRNARTHGAYETLSLEQLSPEEREVFDRIEAVANLEDELRILRFELLRLLPEDLKQNIVSGDGTIATPKAGEITKVEAIANLVGEIRQIVKEMKDLDGEDPLAELLAKIDLFTGQLRAG